MPIWKWWQVCESVRTCIRPEYRKKEKGNSLRKLQNYKTHESESSGFQIYSMNHSFNVLSDMLVHSFHFFHTFSQSRIMCLQHFVYCRTSLTLHLSPTTSDIWVSMYTCVFNKPWPYNAMTAELISNTHYWNLTPWTSPLSPDSTQRTPFHAIAVLKLSSCIDPSHRGIDFLLLVVQFLRREGSLTSLFENLRLTITNWEKQACKESWALKENW